jgi:DNA-binding NtrC family response regulator
MKETRVLVVDDNSGIRSLLRSILESGGYQVAEASNGRLAIEHLRTNHADLVMMDLVMPEQEGIETIKELRVALPNLRIIAMSGAFGGDYLKVARLLGASDALQKPFGIDEVLECVKRNLENG